LVEVLPAYDNQAENTSFLASVIAYEFITSIALNKRDRS